MASASTRQARSRAMLRPNSPMREIARRSATTRMQARIGRVASFAEMRTPAILVEKPVAYSICTASRASAQATTSSARTSAKRGGRRPVSEGIMSSYAVTHAAGLARTARPRPRRARQRHRRPAGWHRRRARRRGPHHRARPGDRRGHLGRALPGPVARRGRGTAGGADTAVTWRRFPCSLFSNTPGTNGDWRTAEIAVLAPTDYQRDDLGHLRGKAVIHLGCHIESRQSYRRLMAAGPAFLLMVDTRYPGATPLADGMFPAYTAAIGAVPTLNVAHQDAWDWVRQGATEARCRIVGGMVPATSQNIVIDLAGTDLADEILYVGAHHDTQAASPGADDNASGVIGVLELARLLHGRPRRRTIRIISFGAEEQLSVGSSAYVRTHRRDVSAQGRLMYNLDCVRVRARVAAVARQRASGFRGIVPSSLPGCEPVLPDRHERGPVRGPFPVRGCGASRGVPLPRELQRRPLLPPSSRR